jgi:hypothetical protein
MLIGTGSTRVVMMGYLFSLVLMPAGAIVEYFIGVEAAGQSLQSVSRPLQSAD